MPRHLTRRSVIGATAATLLVGRNQTRAQTAPRAWTYPIGWPGGVPGDGFMIRVGYACKKLPAFPGWWHTGENWHANEGETAGAEVYAVSGGDVVFAGYDYPGPVVIVKHEPELYSMYGHLDDSRDVGMGDRVERGERLGTVLRRTDAPSHLHFEVRTFFERTEVNGTAPSYGVHCGYDCPPGPGYWPMTAPEHPSELGWRHPVHALGRRAFAGRDIPEGVEAVVAQGAANRIERWSAPEGDEGAALVGD
jgi:murein DD-endopeptidase MepM/ murein hydrolase activator NlpD